MSICRNNARSVESIPLHVKEVDIYIKKTVLSSACSKTKCPENGSLRLADDRQHSVLIRELVQLQIRQTPKIPKYGRGIVMIKKNRDQESANDTSFLFADIALCCILLLLFECGHHLSLELGVQIVVCRLIHVMIVIASGCSMLHVLHFRICVLVALLLFLLGLSIMRLRVVSRRVSL